MAVYVNRSGQARTWLNLTNPDTGRTLHLEPGEEIELDVPDGFTDPHLQPKTSVSPRRKAPRRKPAPKPDLSPDTPEEHEA